MMAGAETIRQSGSANDRQTTKATPTPRRRFQNSAAQLLQMLHEGHAQHAAFFFVILFLVIWLGGGAEAAVGRLRDRAGVSRPDVNCLLMASEAGASTLCCTRLCSGCELP